MPSRTQSILIGGLVAGILSTSVLGLINILCCAGVIIGGIVGVWHYTEEHQLTIPSEQGALIGALSGAAGAVIAMVLNQILAAVGLNFGMADTSEFMQQFGGGMSAEQRDLAEQLQSGQLGILLTIGATLFSAVLFSIFGAIGGAIGASTFQKGDTPSEDSSEGPDTW